MRAFAAASAIEAHAASSALMPSPLRTTMIGCCIAASGVRPLMPTRSPRMTPVTAANAPTGMRNLELDSDSTDAVRWVSLLRPRVQHRHNPHERGEYRREGPESG